MSILLPVVFAVVACFQQQGSVFEQINQLTFSPDGQTLASAADDGSVRIWEVATGKQSHVLKSPERQRRALAVAFSPDGKTLASGGDVQPLKLWDLSTGQVRASLTFGRRLQNACISSIAFSPSGHELAVGVGNAVIGSSFRCEAIVWDLVTDKQLLRVMGGASREPCVAFTPDGTRLALAGGEDPVLLQVATGQKIAELQTTGATDRAGAVFELAIAKTSPTLAAVVTWSTSRTTFEYGVVLRDTVTGKQLSTLPKQTEKISSVALSHDGSLLAWGSWDGTVKIWTVATGKERAVLQSTVGPVNSVAISPDAKTVAAGGRNGTTIQLWKIPEP